MGRQRAHNRTAPGAVRRRLAVLSGVLLAIACAPLAAQQPASTWPAKPVRVVVGVSPGGLQDTLARAIAQELGKRWSQPVIVETRPGANGIIATEFAAKSAPDGHTLLMTDSAPITVNPYLYRKLPYDPRTDFTPIVLLAEVAYLMVAHPSVEARNLQELLALARARPESVHYASYGLGSSNHLETESLSNEAGVRFTHVPYKGGSDLMPALLSGQIQFALVGIAPVLAHVRQGRLKAIVYGAGRRSTLLPDVPTIGESGMPGYESRTWLGWMAPTGTPREITERIAADVGAIITTPEIRDRYFVNAGLELANLPPARFEAFLRADHAKNAERLKRIPLRLD